MRKQRVHLPRLMMIRMMIKRRPLVFCFIAMVALILLVCSIPTIIGAGGCNARKFWTASGAYCIDPKNLLGHNFMPNVCKGVEAVMNKGASVLDLGAGYGYFGRCLLRSKRYMLGPVGKMVEDEDFFKKMGDIWSIPKKIQSYEAYDGASGITDITHGYVKQADFTHPLMLGRTYDWVVTLEVAEHIPPRFERVFLQNIVRHAEIGVVISWAVRSFVMRPGTEAAHPNQKDNDEVVQLFAEYGMSWRPELQDLLRGHLDAADPAAEGHYWRHIMVFAWDKEYSPANNYSSPSTATGCNCCQQ